MYTKFQQPYPGSAARIEQEWCEDKMDVMLENRSPDMLSKVPLHQLPYLYGCILKTFLQCCQHGSAGGAVQRWPQRAEHLV